MKHYRINEDKLRRPDSYRIQAQIESIRNKLIYAVGEGYLSDEFPSNAKEVRDCYAGETVKKVIEVINITWNSNPSVKTTFPKWIEDNVDPKLYKEIKQIWPKANIR